MAHIMQVAVLNPVKVGVAANVAAHSGTAQRSVAHHANRAGR